MNRFDLEEIRNELGKKELEKALQVPSWHWNGRVFTPHLKMVPRKDDKMDKQ